MEIAPSEAVRLPAWVEVDDWAYVEEPEVPESLEFFALRQVVTWSPRLTPAQERQKADKQAQQALRERRKAEREQEKAAREAERLRTLPARREAERVKRWFASMRPPEPCKLCGFPCYPPKTCPGCIRERDRVYREVVTSGWVWLELADGSRLQLAPSQLEQFTREAERHSLEVGAWALHRLGTLSCFCQVSPC